MNGENMKKNLLFLMADQFAFQALGYIDSRVRTPNLDRIAKTGICFSHCYTNSPLCMPARAALATGLYPEELNTIDNYATGLTTESQTWMQRIQSAGYETSIFGKVHLHRFCPDLRDKLEQTMGYGYQIVNELPGPRTYATMRSSYYDYLQSKDLLECYKADMQRRYKDGPVYDSTPTPLPTEDYADVYIANRALEYLECVSAAQPWFCTVSFGGPHDPWDTPAEYVGLYKDVIPAQPLAAPESQNPRRPRGVYDEILNGTYDPSLTEKIRDMTPEDIAALRRSYYGHVTLIDDQIGRIMKCLEQRNMLENTIVVFTSDHGEENGDYGLLFKQTFFESSVRVPLMIFVPGKSPQSIWKPVELMDLGPTLCQLLEIHGEIGHARSLMPLVDGAPAAKQHVASQIFGETMLLEDSWKVVFNRDDDPYLLFNMEMDPEESCNLAGAKELAEVEEHLRQSLTDWRSALRLERGRLQ